MATTITFNANSAHSLLLSVSGTGGSTSKTRAEVLAACAEGPLKALLTRAGDWTTFNFTGVNCDKIRVRGMLNRASGILPTIMQFTWTATGIQADATGDRGGVGLEQIEIRIPHSSRI